MKVSTLVFDLDGTISDPSSGIIKCVNYALQCRGLATQSDASVSAEIGPPLDLMFRKFMPDITDEVIDELVFSYRERFATCLLYTSPSPRDKRQSRMPSSA